MSAPRLSLAYPRLWRPTTVPTFPTVVDWAHPLAQGLVRLWLLNTPGPPVDKVLGSTSTAIAVAPALASTVAGPMHTFVKANNSGWTVSSGAIIGGLPAWSCVGVASITGFDNNDWSIYSERAATGNDILSFGTSGYYSGGAGASITFRNDAGALVNGPGSGTASAHPWSDGKLHVIVGTKTASAIKTYTDGASELNTSGVGVGFTDPNVSIIGASPVDSRCYWGGSIGMVALYSRELTASDAAWLTAEPFAMLRPVVRRPFFVGATAVAPTADELFFHPVF